MGEKVGGVRGPRGAGDARLGVGACVACFRGGEGERVSDRDLFMGGCDEGVHRSITIRLLLDISDFVS